MKITLKLFAGLADHLPADAVGNAITLAVAAETTPHALLDRRNIPRNEAQVIMRNGEACPPEARDEPLKDGDVIAVWPSIQGG